MPILLAFRELDARGERAVTTGAIADDLGLGRRDVAIGLAALEEAGYLRWGALARNGADDWTLRSPRLRERGRRATGSWPQAGVEGLVAILEARLVTEMDPEQRGRLEVLRDALLGVGRDVGTSILTAWAKGQIGL